MKSFIDGEGSNELEHERASTADLMRFLLSYACNPVVSNTKIEELVESSARNLFNELVNTSKNVRGMDLLWSTPRQVSDRYGQTPRPFGQNIEMKKGDWICGKCNFMNFARNMKCLECDGPRAKGLTSGREWECSQFHKPHSILMWGSISTKQQHSCRGVTVDNEFSNSRLCGWLKPFVMAVTHGWSSYAGLLSLQLQVYILKDQFLSSLAESPRCGFFSHTRNAICLRCECKRPGEPSPTSPPRFDLRYSSGSYLNNTETESKIASNEDKAERMFSKISQLDNVCDLNSASSDEAFPEIMPMRKGMNTFVVSTRKTPLERRLADVQYRKNLGNDGEPDRPSKTAGKSSISETLDRILGRSATMENLNGDSVGVTENLKSKSVPFVPLPADMFSKSQKREIQSKEDAGQSEKSGRQFYEVAEFSQRGFMEGIVESACGGPTGNSTGRIDHLEASNSKSWNNGFCQESRPYNVSGAVNSSEQGKRPHPSKDSRDPTGGFEGNFNASNVDFSYVRPTRNSVPRHDDLRASNQESWNVGSSQRLENRSSDRENWNMGFSRSLNENKVESAYRGYTENLNPNQYDLKTSNQESWNSCSSQGRSSSQQWENPQSSNYVFSRRHVNENKVDSVHTRATESFAPRLDDQQARNPESWNNSSWQSWNTGFPGTHSSQHKADSFNSVPTGYSSGRLENRQSAVPQPESPQNSRDNWSNEFSGKSLEGSAVKELDPLDMSEEAKTQRWFRRVAQIKDISELSQIPDEDFPSIMPMRKGVNRFVVSKRKTPLERRLTSQQYSRNLPTMSSELPVKKDDDLS
ncbi:hypothetical protein GIB67_006698 [Kingdonia uniflora]|uniref:RanBP2-type domain-containing protein n=1 Tax=Kingdonia uniflora TaxID=39325 RepID=A0A7J7LYN2_9MAGN|nr:hypothetical protein GIB67_006698 [Kingdonia uniflora]